MKCLGCGYLLFTLDALTRMEATKAASVPFPVQCVACKTVMVLDDHFTKWGWSYELTPFEAKA